MFVQNFAPSMQSALLSFGKRLEPPSSPEMPPKSPRRGGRPPIAKTSFVHCIGAGVFFLATVYSAWQVYQVQPVAAVAYSACFLSPLPLILRALGVKKAQHYYDDLSGVVGVLFDGQCSE